MGRKMEDLKGKKFGELTVLRKSEKKTKDNRTMWLCLCSCGQTKSVRPSDLKRGQAKSCGCKQGRPKAKLSGKRFSRLTVIKESHQDKRKQVIWECKCDCGSFTKVSTNNLNSGNTKSCGCYEKDMARNAAKKRMIGKTFGRLKVVSLHNGEGDLLWDCECLCGGKALTRTTDLTSGHTKSCGCLQKERASESSKANLSGGRFGRLIVIKEIGTKDYGGSSKVKWLCKCDCGNHTELFTSTLTTGNTKSCGCLSKEMIGEKSPAYKPHLTEEDRRKGRYAIGGFYADKWRRQVFEKDNYTCEACGQHGGTLNAHHLDGWSWCKDKRFDIDNGITLCKECHIDFHKMYGKTHNTKEQFEEYLNKIKNNKVKQLALF